MEFERFEACARAYGGKRERWPPGDRPLHDRFAATPQGAALLADAERTDRFLDAWQESPMTGALVDRIAGAAMTPRRAARRPLLWSAAAFAASAVFGFAIGFAEAPADPRPDALTVLILGPASAQETGL